MFHIFTTFGALLLFFALTWHDQPAKPIVIERRPVRKQPARRQKVEDTNEPSTTPTPRPVTLPRIFSELAHSPNQKSG